MWMLLLMMTMKTMAELTLQERIPAREDVRRS